VASGQWSVVSGQWLVVSQLLMVEWRLRTGDNGLAAAGKKILIANKFYLVPSSENIKTGILIF